MPPISEHSQLEKITSPDAVSEAHKGWKFSLGSIVIAWGAKFGLAGFTALPVIVLGLALFLPPIFAILGLIYSIGAWKNHSKINGMLVPAILGTVLALVAIGSIVLLLISPI